jgi:hypothetical protein
MQNPMARQGESEHARRAKVTHAEGEFQASARLRDAAAVPEEYSSAAQLRFLETVTSLGNEKSTVVVPLPLKQLDLACLAPSRSR